LHVHPQVFRHTCSTFRTRTAPLFRQRQPPARRNLFGDYIATSSLRPHRSHLSGPYRLSSLILLSPERTARVGFHPTFPNPFTGLSTLHCPIWPLRLTRVIRPDESKWLQISEIIYMRFILCLTAAAHVCKPDSHQRETAIHSHTAIPTKATRRSYNRQLNLKNGDVCTNVGGIR
jgi:hypothetical protein